MSPKFLRIIGLAFLVVAAIVGVLNLKRVADLGLSWLSPTFVVLGVALVAIARRKRQ